MKVRLFNEDFRDGLTVDWPAIPCQGDMVCFRHRGGTSNFGVRQVRWQAETDGKLIEVEIHLTY